RGRPTGPWAGSESRRLYRRGAGDSTTRRRGLGSFAGEPFISRAIKRDCLLPTKVEHRERHPHPQPEAPRAPTMLYRGVGSTHPRFETPRAPAACVGPRRHRSNEAGSVTLISVKTCITGHHCQLPKLAVVDHIGHGRFET